VLPPAIQSRPLLDPYIFLQSFSVRIPAELEWSYNKGLETSSRHGDGPAWKVPRDYLRVMNILARLSLTVVLLAAGSSQPANAQLKQANKTKQDTGIRYQRLIERGEYIVEGVAMCERCHTRRDEHGNPDRMNWLMGGPVQTEPTYSAPTWAISEPRLAGMPPGTDAEFVTLLTTGISRTGRPPNPPMPPFRMTRGDAEAVLAYLKSLRR
jgi:hypothetical protein